MVINFLGKRFPLPWLGGGGGFYVIRGMWLPSRLSLEGSNHLRVFEP
jgi:hypothetical protein